jgi:hypothetical protein
MLHRDHNCKDIIKVSEISTGQFRVDYYPLSLSAIVKTYEEAEALYGQAYIHWTQGGRFGGLGAPRLTLWGKG